MEGAFQTIGEAAEAQGSQDAEEGIERREDGIITAVSYCVHCEEDGLTTFLPTVIPHFKRVIVSAFSCPHCSYRNSELQLADYEDKGCQYTLQVEGAESLNRQVVKSNKATLRIPELEFEIPATAESKALISTLEGLLVQHIDNLESDQPVRRALEPDNADKIDAFLAKLKKCANAEMPFTFVLRDPSGNSFVENPLAPATDPKLQAAFFTRSMDENEVLGITHDADAAAPRIEDEFEYGVGTEDLAQFNGTRLSLLRSVLHPGKCPSHLNLPARPQKCVTRADRKVV
jgi:zinc finger protein